MAKSDLYEVLNKLSNCQQRINSAAALFAATKDRRFAAQYYDDHVFWCSMLTMLEEVPVEFVDRLIEFLNRAEDKIQGEMLGLARQIDQIRH